MLFAFGPTDYFEAENGNEWWHPWWLFLWKAACVVALLAIVGNAWRRERRGRKARGATAGRPAEVNALPPSGTTSPRPL